MPVPRALAVTTVCTLVGALSWSLVAMGNQPHGPDAPERRPSAVIETPGRSGSQQRDEFDRSAHSLTRPSSIWVIVNKSHPISPLAFRPQMSIVRGYQVSGQAAGALTRLLDASDTEGLGFKIASAFRSYEYQASVHDRLAAAQGEEAADKVSARPGYSEHQTGLAVDLITPAHPECDFEQCFARTAGGRWLKANAWRYGFIVRYTVADQRFTGYSPEPWHLRYVGPELAAELRATGQGSLEQFFGVTGGDYQTR